jgi:membrane protease YdiL (CAAX protease family)
LYPNRPIPHSRAFQFGMFLTGLCWLFVASLGSQQAAQGLSLRFNLTDCEPLLRSAFFLLLVVVGFTTLQRMTVRASEGIRQDNALPARPTASREWATGAAFGWGLALAVALLLAIFRALEPHFWFSLRSLGQTLISLATLALGTLALEAAFRGYLYRRLIDSIGVVPATTLLSLIYAFVVNFNIPSATLLSFVTTFVLGIIFSIAYLRTHALWLGWGLHFAWASVLAVFFGLVLAGDGGLSTIVTTDIAGPNALTGAGFGPEGSVLTLILALASIPLLYRITRDFAWTYTHPEIVSAGYAMEAQPPAAHEAMQNSVAPPPPPPLVQILGTTSTNASTLPVIDQHLRGE